MLLSKDTSLIILKNKNKKNENGKTAVDVQTRSFMVLLFSTMNYYTFSLVVVHDESVERTLDDALWQRSQQPFYPTKGVIVTYYYLLLQRSLPA